MRQPIVFSMQQRARRSMLNYLVLMTCVLGGYTIFTMLTSQGLDSQLSDLLLALRVIGGGVCIGGYVFVLVTYFRVRYRPFPPIIIDEAGIHANKLFIAWDNIAAIYPCRVSSQIEAVGVLPRDLALVLRQSRLNLFTRITLRLTAPLLRSRGLPPFLLRPDVMTIQELLQRLWYTYYPEYYRYHISPYPPMSMLR